MLGKYKREYCCPRCGLIWFDTTTTANTTVCKECGNSNKEDGLYACDSMGYAYAYGSIEVDLKERGKEIHYDKEHPYYDKK
ncbi:hypothetical protein N493_20175 (plasmid) [Clostridium botulinum B2 433]|uniref:hypothetical protein n=1 Tax=Clostridium botulinum TaxID=1491 RepID=UPI0007E1849A|nr:hypothetical protein [Clostridium botulinum]KEI84193.1 hypothetical protein N493_20175 [Clostridium botulinum B2 433]HCL4480177.1 hypothetical protein [Clostridium botulinum]HDK7218105.1 hypothetical protein [Clostridium botulinum]